MIDLGVFDAMRPTPPSKEEQEQVFARFKAAMEAYKAWMELAEKLPTYEQLREARK